MKTFTELTPEQRLQAQHVAYTKLLKGICEGYISFKGNDSIEPGIRAAERKCEEMKTPWFMSEYVHDYVGDLLWPLAEDDARACVYAERDDAEVVYGVVE